jgi:hypothetical protein
MADFELVAHTLDAVSQEIRQAGGLVNDRIHFVQSSNEGFGIFARSDVAAGETLINVPFSLCITTEKIASSETLKQLISENEGLMNYPDEVLAIGLMHAKLFPSASCSWSKHVEMLPTEFNTTIYWSAEELEGLKGNTVYHLTQMMKRQIEGDFNSIHLGALRRLQQVAGDHPQGQAHALHRARAGHGQPQPAHRRRLLRHVSLR